MKKLDLIGVREYKQDDKNFVLATWLRGLYYGDTWFTEMPKDTFMTNYHPVLNALMAKENVKINIACLKDDPEVILGYIVTNDARDTVHWIFVKSAWRGIGLAKLLFPTSIKTATHLTKLGLSLIKKSNKAIVFNPFSL